MLYKQVGDSFGEAVVTAAKQLLLLVNQHGVSFTSTSIIDADWSVLEQVSVETEFSPQLATACAALWGDDKVQRVFHSTRRLEAYLPATTEELLDNALVHFGNEYAQAELDSSCIYTPTKSTQDHTLLLPGLDLTIMDSSGHSLQNPNHKWATQCPNQDLIVFFVSLCGYARVSSHCICTAHTQNFKAFALHALHVQRTTDGSANQLMQSLESFNQLMLVLNMDPRHLQECPAHQLFEESALGKPSERESVTRVHVVFTMLDLLDSFLADVPLQQVFPEFKEAGTSHAAAAFIQSLFVSIFKFHRGASAHLSSHYVNARSPKDCIGVLEKLCGSNGLVVAEDAPSGCCGT